MKENNVIGNSPVELRNKRVKARKEIIKTAVKQAKKTEIKDEELERTFRWSFQKL